MSNLLSQLKAEIQRLCRKEIRPEVDALRKSTSSYRAEISNLKRRISELESRVKRLTKATPVKKSEPEKISLRWRSSGFSSLRKKLGLSASEMGRLIGVTSATVYAWENGKSKPRASQLNNISHLRKMGKRDVASILEKLE